jgi:ABC-type polysaccharide/polyol phosphate export permease
MVGSVGYSLIEGGLTLALKRVELLHELALGLMVFFSGALVPLDRLPTWMADIGRFTPISQGIVALRAMLVNGAAGLPLGGDGGLVPLAAVSFAYLFAGIIVFSVGEAMAKRRGSLARY